jgi:beta-galactosidase
MYLLTLLDQEYGPGNDLKMTLKPALLLLLLCLTLTVGAQEPKNEFSLDGKWEIIFDHHNTGRSQNLHTNHGFEHHSDKRSIAVPSCWEEIEQDYEGVAYYRKKFTIPASWEGKMVYINFDAVNYVAEVWLNNHVIDFHEGGFTPFSFRIDKSVKFGEDNVLTMRVAGPIILTDKMVDNMGPQETPQWRGGDSWWYMATC